VCRCLFLRFLCIFLCSTKHDSHLSFPNALLTAPCNGFTTQCLSNIDAKAFTVTSQCLADLSDTLRKALSAAQLGTIPDGAFASLSNLGGWNPTSCSGFRAAQVENWSKSYPNSQCDSTRRMFFKNLVVLLTFALTCSKKSRFGRSLLEEYECYKFC
jgi:hypothetical protein